LGALYSKWGDLKTGISHHEPGWVKIGKRKKGHEAGKEQNSITKARNLENTKKGRGSFLHFVVEDLEP
jgi:hypothetical protein